MKHEIGVRAAFLAFALTTLLTACSSDPPPAARFAQFDYTELPQIQLDVAEVVIEQRYRPSGSALHVEERLPLPPAAAAARWAEQRLVAAGDQGSARFIVHVAHVVEVPLERSGGISGFFTVEQAVRYDARLAVELAAEDPGSGRSATIKAETLRSVSVPENVTLEERDQVWQRMTEQMMRDLNAELEAEVRQALSGFIKQPES